MGRNAAGLHSGIRVARRQDGAGAQLLLLSLLAGAGIDPASLTMIRPDCITGTDIADRIRRGQADCGIATRSVAARGGDGLRAVDLGDDSTLFCVSATIFCPDHRRYSPLFGSDRFRQRAAELGGYDLSVCGEIRLVN